jgi:hypothetical protein
MTQPGGAWGRFREEVRSATHRTGRQARRAFDAGIIRVDLVSLRREHRRALADLGERLTTLWTQGSLDGIEHDLEMIRLRARVDGIDAAMVAKEAESRRLHDAEVDRPDATTRPIATPES